MSMFCCWLRPDTLVVGVHRFSLMQHNVLNFNRLNVSSVSLRDCSKVWLMLSNWPLWGNGSAEIRIQLVYKLLCESCP